MHESRLLRQAPRHDDKETHQHSTRIGNNSLFVTAQYLFSASSFINTRHQLRILRSSFQWDINKPFAGPLLLRSVWAFFSLSFSRFFECVFQSYEKRGEWLFYIASVL